MLGQAVLGEDVPYIEESLILLVVLTTLASSTLILPTGPRDTALQPQRGMKSDRRMKLRQRVFFWIGAFAVFVGFVMLFEPILLPFLVGFAVAYFLDPICDRLESAGCSRTLATLLVTAGFFWSLHCVRVGSAGALQTSRSICRSDAGSD